MATRQNRRRNDTTEPVRASAHDAEHTVGIEERADPTQNDIAQRAYQFYLARGGEHGLDLEDWFRAERELRK